MITVEPKIQIQSHRVNRSHRVNASCCFGYHNRSSHCIHFFHFQAIDGALDFASKVQQEQADSLRKRKNRELQSVNQAPPPGLLRSLRRKKNEELRSTRVIKPGTSTPDKAPHARAIAKTNS